MPSPLKLPYSVVVKATKPEINLNQSPTTLTNAPRAHHHIDHPKPAAGKSRLSPGREVMTQPTKGSKPIPGNAEVEPTSITDNLFSNTLATCLGIATGNDIRTVKFPNIRTESDKEREVKTLVSPHKFKFESEQINEDSIRDELASLAKVSLPVETSNMPAQVKNE
ncbi:hypothetical protein APHAL10511_002351 [Amanita phalloides]|nr:hypothetical protein APHAL10511_002351 [Amanita phalloides]